jgi:REP element-mobilizing transposase RayT
LQGYDYTLPGAYFITLVTKGRQAIFGELVGDQILLSSCGQLVAEEWARTAKVRPELTLDVFVVMPNHFHAILFLNDQSRIQLSLGAHRGAPLRLPKLHRQPKSLGSIIAGFKSKASQSAGQSLWQRNYYDHIIRDERELNQIREYILHNPLLLSQVFDAK